MAASNVITYSAPLNPGRLVDIAVTCTADASNNFLPIVIPNTPLLLLGAEIAFDTIATPNSLSFPINTPSGVAMVASQTLTSSGPIVMPVIFVPFPSGMSIPVTGNTTPGGIFRMILKVIAG